MFTPGTSKEFKRPRVRLPAAARAGRPTILARDASAVGGREDRDALDVLHHESRPARRWRPRRAPWRCARGPSSPAPSARPPSRSKPGRLAPERQRARSLGFARKRARAVRAQQCPTSARNVVFAPQAVPARSHVPHPRDPRVPGTGGAPGAESFRVARRPCLPPTGRHRPSKGTAIVGPGRGSRLTRPRARSRPPRSARSRSPLPGGSVPRRPTARAPADRRESPCAPSPSRSSRRGP